MKSFSLMIKAQRETAAVNVAALTLVFLLLASMIVTNVVKNKLYLHTAFYVGVVIFGLIGFLALDILASLSFLGDGAKVGVGAFIAILLVGAWTGGAFIEDILSGSIVGLFLFYVKSVYGIYRVLKVETRPEDPVLTFTELNPHGALNHFMLEGTGSNFELLTNIIQALNGDHDLMFYARYDPPDYNRVDEVLSETMKFYANHMMTLHRVNSSKSEHIIKQICFECTSPEVLEKGLINYWLRAHLTGGYTCIVVPYDDDFIKKAKACESSYEADLDIEEIIGGASWLFKTESLTRIQDNYHDFYTSWDVARLRKKIATVHPIG